MIGITQKNNIKAPNMIKRPLNLSLGYISQSILSFSLSTHAGGVPAQQNLHLEKVGPGSKSSQVSISLPLNMVTGTYSITGVCNYLLSFIYP